jgi:rhodanese-related sulfurtransferase
MRLHPPLHPNTYSIERLALFLAWFFSLMLQGPAGASGPIELTADGNIRETRSRAYCGIYAAYGAASAVWKKSGRQPIVEFHELLTKEYVSSYSGSSTQDLLNAVDKLGCGGKAYQCLSLRSLEGASCPMILHVSGRGALGSYQHWILFLGIESGNAVVRDGEGSDYPMPISELLVRWDGKAIAVFPRHVAPPRLHSWEILTSCILLGGVGFLVRCVRTLAADRSFRTQSLAFCCLTGTVLLYCFAINPKVRVEANVARAVELHTDPSRVATLGFDEMQRCVASERAIIIDSRYRTDYEYGSITHALNVPVDVSQEQLLATTRKLPKDRPIVLFCQSRGCEFSDIIAVELAKLGFTKLSIYRNGYAEWEANSRQLKQPG